MIGLTSDALRTVQYLQFKFLKGTSRFLAIVVGLGIQKVSPINWYMSMAHTVHRKSHFCNWHGRFRSSQDSLASKTASLPSLGNLGIFDLTSIIEAVLLADWSLVISENVSCQWQRVRPKFYPTAQSPIYDTLDRRRTIQWQLTVFINNQTIQYCTVSLSVSQSVHTLARWVVPSTRISVPQGVEEYVAMSR